eukprot:364548-Chlamydomonas_euryale.AAC.1
MERAARVERSRCGAPRVRAHPHPREHGKLRSPGLAGLCGQGFKKCVGRVLKLRGSGGSQRRVEAWRASVGELAEAAGRRHRATACQLIPGRTLRANPDSPPGK